MKYLIIILFSLGLYLFVTGYNQNDTPVKTAIETTEDEDTLVVGPKIELVFCLDATGSMSGLIQTAKDKIWDIVSELAQRQSAPEIKLGMIFYRDRGDQFVTRMYPLSSDIDSIYTELLNIGALGGGDAPESVNLALHEAVGHIGWSDDKEVYRTIFLVGDCPPHMDYQDEIQYPETCKLANQKSITINTIKLGNSCTEAIEHFKSIANSTNGHYMQIDQNASDIVIQTPYDDSIADYTHLIDDSKIYYGSQTVKSYNGARKEKATEIYTNASMSTNSDRAEYNMTKSGKSNWFGKNELIEDLSNKQVQLDSIPKDQLPDELKGLSETELNKKVNSITEERKNNMEKLEVLINKRREYIKAEMAKEGETTFSQHILAIMKKQATKQGVEL